MDIELLKFPVGKFHRPKEFSTALIADWINIIKKLPFDMRKTVEHLSKEDLHLSYRPEGWNILQVVHHLADSHMNSFIRFKLALTEENPTIKPYHENLWAQLPDVTDMPVELSLKMLEGIHLRWACLMESMNEEEWQRTFVHPEYGTQMSLYTSLALYAWHCNHHLAHIHQALKFKEKWD